MSELIRQNSNRTTLHRKLLMTASALALTAYVSSAGVVRAEDTGGAPFWIELGGQLSRQNDSQEKLDAPWFGGLVSSGLTSPLEIEKAPKYSIDEYGKISFRPNDGDWVVSASLRYGRSTNKNQVQQKTNRPPMTVTGVPNSSPPPYSYTLYAPPYNYRFADTHWTSSEKHTVLDFQVGKDVGLGLFGGGSSSQLDLGVRFAQFSSKSNADVNGDPTIRYPTHPTNFFSFFFKYKIDENVYWQQNVSESSFHGIGPSLSWQGSAPIVGNTDSAQLQIDWGINAAVLFGRQKARGYHQSSSVYLSTKGAFRSGGVPTHFEPRVTHDRSRSVTVPNIGGSLGLSFQSGDAKVSFGYRADLFINAMDAGIDVAKKSNMVFHGPYASISIGLGD